MTEESNLELQNDPVDETSLKYMLKLALPMIATTISFTIMQFVDRSMVARLGKEALAAVLPAGIISFIPASFALGIITCLNTFVSQSLGRGEKKQCANYCWQVIYMGVLYMSMVVLFMWPAAPWIFRSFGFEPAVVEMEIVYFRVMLFAQVLAVFIWSSSQFFMGIYRPVIIMYSAICGQTVNIVANYLLIFGKFGFPKLGIKGAAIGTLIGIAVGATIRMVMFLNGDINKTFKCRQSLYIDFRKMGNLLKIGLPAGFAFMVNVTILGTILFGLVSRFGTEASAATSAIFACINVSVMPVVGLSTALTAAVGNSIGKGRIDIAIKQTSVSLKVALVYMGLAGICFYVFRTPIMKWWAPGDAEVVAVGMKILICAAIFQLFDAATLTYNGALRGAGDTVWLAGISITGVTLILGLGGFLIVRFFPELGAVGPWIAFTANIIFMGLANRWRFKSKRWTKIELFKKRAATIPVEIEKVVQ